MKGVIPVMNQQKIRKNIHIAVVVTSILLIAIFLITKCVFLLLGWRYGLFVYQVKDFNRYKGDLTALAETLIERTSPAFEADENLSRVQIEDGMYVSYHYTSGESKRGYEEADEHTLSCFPILHEMFPHDTEGFGSFWYIQVTRDEVAFQSYGPYVLVYSKHKRPSSTRGSEAHEYFVDRLSSHWYQMVDKNF